MKLTKQQIRVLEAAFDKAANLSGAHALAVQSAERLFEQFFGESVPEEAMSGFSSPKEEVGSLFNNYVCHDENMAGDNATTKDLIRMMEELMNMSEE